MKFAFIDANRDLFDICVMCSVLEVTKSGFYAWRKRPDSKREVRSQQLGEKIRIIHEESDGIYGSRKITRELRHRQIVANHKMVAALMQNMGIRSKVCRKYKVQTTDSNHSNPVAPNTLNRKFDSATAPNQIWSTDITYIHTAEGFMYLAGVMDLFSRKIVGWNMDDNLTATLVQDAMNAALFTRKNAFGLMHHSDRGVQYTSSPYRELLNLYGIQASMSRTGNCYDNAPVESFWGKLKTEMVYHRRFATKQEAKRAVFEYIEMFYNRKRLHAALGYVSPEQFELSQKR